MGAKASTANGEGQRERTFSTSSSEVGGSGGFNILRGIPGVVSADRARSFSSPDGRELQNGQEHHAAFESVETDSSSTEEHLDSPLNPFPRVYTPHSLPSHIFSWNGIKCPVCSKFVLPDDIECHLVMCLTKPRLIYNEDVLTEDKGECVICLEELTQGNTIARLPCLCIYHKSCIDRWFDVNRSCPEHPGD
ncbi:E3 ubiquitin-protein ligase ZNRF2 [Cimex lectularius]|uniref:E3 ubiquitin-protein ligase ZNRF1 n=1 Tax=Cimex lectularius TaxID=79782 RepID=A0A8I6RBX8_CIMLE|nr:E3 ubiquitin-protein ligase ZNRF2 [Cimex lectularius]